MKTNMKDIAFQNERTILSGLENIDKLTCGWHKADLILVAGRPAMGKTAFAVSMANQMTECLGYSVAYFSLELSKTVLLERFEKIGNPAHNTQLYIEDNLDFTITEIIEKARAYVVEQKVQFIILDYLQLIVAAENIFTNRKEELGQILQSLKALAVELDVPIIVLSQLPRSVEQSEDKKPKLEGLRDIDIQSVDTAIFLYRPGYYHLSRSDNRNIAELIIAKNNHGNVGTAESRFFEETNSFKDYKSKIIMNPTTEDLKTITASLNECNGILTAEQEESLVRQIREGNFDSLGELLEGNIRFVVSVAKNYQNKGLEMQDLIAHGTRGLVEAAKNFDESKEVRFLSYAIWWIRQSIIEAIDAK